MEIPSKRIVPKYSIEVKIRQPLQEKEYETISNPVFSVTKTFPDFLEHLNGNDTTNNTNANKKVEVDLKLKEEALKKSTNTTTTTKPNTTTNTTTTNTNKQPQNQQPPVKKEVKQVEKIDPSIFSDADLKNPNNLDNINTLKVLDYLLFIVDKEIEQVEGRIPKDIRERKLKLKCKKNQFVNAMGDGTISFPDYVALIIQQYEKDKKMSIYFSQIGDNNKKILVDKKLPVIKKELEEAMAEAKKMGIKI